MQTSEQNHSLEERVSELEAQVADLQKKVALLSGQEPETVTVETPEVAVVEEDVIADEFVPEKVVAEPVAVEPIVTEPVVTDVVVSDVVTVEVEPENVQVETSTEEPCSIEPVKESKSLESKIGKMIIPVAGSALIIFALVLFGSLIQPHLTNMMKAVLMAVGSLAITGLGMWKMKPETRYYNFFAALAGCGAAGCYITALVSHFALEVLPEVGLMGCIVVWIAAMTAFSRYKSRIFCYICYVGILVAAYMTVRRWSDSSLGLWVYIASVGALFMTNVTRKYKQDAWLLIQYPLIMCLMSAAYQNNNFPLFVIFVTTAAVLVGQIIIYSREVEKKEIFLIPTAFSLVVLLCCAVGFDNSVGIISVPLLFLAYLGQPIFDNHWAWSILLSGTLIGLCALYMKWFRFSASVAEKLLIVIVVGFTALYVPQLNFGEFYNSWCGVYWVPALVVFGIGCYFDRKEFRYLGYVYLFLYSLASVSRLEILHSVASGQDDITMYYLECNVFVYWATLLGFGAWVLRHRIEAEKEILLACCAWGIITLSIGNWIDVDCCYLLLCAYFLVLIFKVLPSLSDRKWLLLNRQNFILMCTGMAIMVLPVRLFDDDMQMALISIPSAYGGPIIGLVASLMLFTLANVSADRKLRMISYGLFAINMYVCSGDTIGQDMFAWCLYLAGLAWFVYWTVHHYSRNDKLCLAALVLLFFFKLGELDILNGAECWALCALFVLACGVFRFAYNPHSGELEPLSHNVCNGAHEVLLMLGTFLLLSCHEPLCFVILIDGTEPVITILLVVLTLMLAVSNLKRVNGLMQYWPEHWVSIYNGGKFTWALIVILHRFSAVSYLVSLAGILLAIAFIVAGFRFKFKGMRLYGLVLTMLCVGKLLFFDIVFDNAFYRPVSFLVAGILLFLISYIYFRLEKGNSVKDEEVRELKD